MSESKVKGVQAVREHEGDANFDSVVELDDRDMTTDEVRRWAFYQLSKMNNGIR